MKRNLVPVVAPVALIVVGTGWLLMTWEIGKGIDWIWTLVLASVGVLAFAVHGIDKLSIVAGPFFLISSVLSVLRQTGRISIDAEVPMLVITVGVLWLIALLPVFPAPSWYFEPRVPQPGDRKPQASEVR